MSGVDRDHITVKAIIIGDSGTGKSSLLHRFTENTYTEDHAQTIGVEFAQKVINVVGRKVKLQVWDTAGQERYRSVTRSYYRGSACCIVCYDLTRHDSFLHIDDWLKDATTLAEKGAKLVLVGNKKDLASRKREVPFADAAAYAQRHGMKFLETSAYLGEGVEEAFHLAISRKKLLCLARPLQKVQATRTRRSRVVAVECGAINVCMLRPSLEPPPQNTLCVALK